MKTNYICETCGKTYDKSDDAAACEQHHEREKLKHEADRKAEEKLLNAIDAAINLYVSRYHRLPPYTLTDENEKIVLDSLTKLLVGGLDLTALLND